MDDMFTPPKRDAEPVNKGILDGLVNNVPKPVTQPPQQITEEAPTEELAPKIEDAELPKPDPTTNTTTLAPKPPKKASWWKRASKKKKILIIAVASVVLAGGGVTAYLLLKKDPPKPTPAPVVVQKAVEPPKPTTEASKLTGVQVDPELNKRGVTGIMIENSMDARPQSGLLDAGIVYEAIAEGGITRFLALYQESQPSYIGPVRSARPYYIDWLLPYNATYAHVGGSPVALQMIQDLKIKDMNEFAYGSSYQRVTNRFAPHNAYTSMANLDAIRTKNNWGNPDFTGFTRKKDAAAKVQTATNIDVKISSVSFNSHYDYDAATNSYKRSEGGASHTDEKTGKQLNPKVVVVLVIPYSIDPDGIHSKYQTVGSGQAFVFQDGIMQDATWSKASQSASLELKDAGGRVLALNAGQTWITAVGQSSMVTYTGPPAPAAGTAQ